MVYQGSENYVTMYDSIHTVNVEQLMETTAVVDHVHMRTILGVTGSELAKLAAHARQVLAIRLFTLLCFKCVVAADNQREQLTSLKLDEKRREEGPR